jgi:DNA-binding NarL/FixJ family response regulator
VVASAAEVAAAPRARAYGAVGFVPKTSDLAALQNAVERALSGARDPADQSPSEPELEQMAGKIAALTPAEIRVLLGVLRGQLNKQIAFDLNISEATVKGHMTVIMRKMNVSNRTQAVLAARALDIQLSD